MKFSGSSARHGALGYGHKGDGVNQHIIALPTVWRSEWDVSIHQIYSCISEIR